MTLLKFGFLHFVIYPLLPGTKTTKCKEILNVKLIHSFIHHAWNLNDTSIHVQ